MDRLFVKIATGYVTNMNPTTTHKHIYTHRHFNTKRQLKIEPLAKPVERMHDLIHHWTEAFYYIHQLAGLLLLRYLLLSLIALSLFSVGYFSRKFLSSWLRLSVRFVFICAKFNCRIMMMMKIYSFFLFSLWFFANKKSLIFPFAYLKNETERNPNEIQTVI